MSHAAFSIDTCSFHRVRCCFVLVGAFRENAPPGPARLCPKNSFPGGWTLHLRMPAQRRPMTLTVVAQAEALRHSRLFKPLKMTPTTFTSSTHPWPHWPLGPLIQITSRFHSLLKEPGLLASRPGSVLALAFRFVIDPSTTQNGRLPLPGNSGNCVKFSSFYMQLRKARNTQKNSGKSWLLFVQVKLELYASETP